MLSLVIIDGILIGGKTLILINHKNQHKAYQATFNHLKQKDYIYILNIFIFLVYYNNKYFI